MDPYRSLDNHVLFLPSPQTCMGTRTPCRVVVVLGEAVVVEAMVVA